MCKDPAGFLILSVLDVVDVCDTCMKLCGISNVNCTTIYELVYGFETDFGLKSLLVLSYLVYVFGVHTPDNKWQADRII